MSPVIETPRAILRSPEARDAAEIARNVADFDVARMTALIPHPYPREVAEGWVEITRLQTRAKTRFVWVIELRGEGVVGAMAVFRRGPCAEWEVGYNVARPFWGRGIASEVLAATIDWTRASLAPTRLIAAHFEDNPASRRVLEKAGFRPTGSVTPMYCLARNARVACIDMALDLSAVEHGA